MELSSTYGVDWDGPLPLQSGVTVPSPEPSLLAVDQALRSHINPLAFSDQLGIDLYVECVQFVTSRMNVQ